MHFPPFSLTVFSTFGLFLSATTHVCLQIPSLCFPSQHNVEVLEPRGSAAGKNKYDATLLSFKSDK